MITLNPLQLTEPLTDTLGIYITVQEASSLTGVSVRSIFSSIRTGYTPYRNGKVPLDPTPEELQKLSNIIEIPLSELPGDAVKHYILDHISHSPRLDADLYAFGLRYGDNHLEALLNDLQVIKEIETWRQTAYSSSPTCYQKQLFSKYDISKTYYYNQRNLIRQYRGYELSKLLRLDSINKFSSLCPLARDFILERTFCYNVSDIKTIYEDLISETRLQGPDICSYCPHNPITEQYKEAKEEIRTQYSSYHLMTCLSADSAKGIIHPNDERTIRRFVKAIPEGIIYLARCGVRRWEAKYGNKLQRRYPSMRNELAMGDHTQLPLMVIMGEDRRGQPIIDCPWATIQVDAASSLITSSVLSQYPDRYTIGYCFATACCVTRDSIASGVPLAFMTDRGRDYLSNYIQGSSKELRHRNPNDSYINRAFFENGLLPVLNCDVIHWKFRSIGNLIPLQEVRSFRCER